ncbi:MAG TPA: 1-deoxy-D-xylulose-5-phosphate reductoisomerase [Fodinibius sp.]|nr:1-deoxy-D-xylulose-5-phosphate reductoisomerase [Fodinibius sp.]
MAPKKIVILGSTGSVGTQTLEVIRRHPERFEILALSCNASWQKMAEQINEFAPAFALLADEKYHQKLAEQLNHGDTNLLTGPKDLLELASLEEADVVLNALVGFAGFEPTIEALKSGNKVALANKESLVVGGALIRDLIGKKSDQLVPVDSEHSAMLQCLVGESIEDVEKLIITASGGPFRDWPLEQMPQITVEDALDHPNWSMGAKITVDSATMMNKGLEIIEAHWLFDIPMERIEAVIHPQSVIHSVISFVDGSSKAQLGPPTMQVPILYALSHPERFPLEAPRLSWSEAFNLSFEPMDYNRFPCLALALEAAHAGGLAPAILNAANEVAVNRFLKREISYIQIPVIIESCLSRLNNSDAITLETIKTTDRKARTLAQNF